MKGWRRAVFWYVIGLALVIAVVLGYGKWVFEVLLSLRSSFPRRYEKTPDYVMINPRTKSAPSEASRSKPPLRVAPQQQPAAGPVVLAKSSELEAVAALQRLLPDTPFHKIRPPWLRNDRTNRRLECDAYSEKLKLCIEVNGEQHYKQHRHFHKSAADFEAQQYRDKLKRTQLREHGDVLIVVPFWIKRKDIEDFLRGELQSRGFKPTNKPTQRT